MSLFKKTLVQYGLCSILVLTTPLSHGLQSDREAPIDIQADALESNEQTGTTKYSGNVIMTRGSMRIDAEQLIIHNERSKITKIVAIGVPARFQQQPAEEAAPVVAQAERLEYHISDDALHLVGSAFLEQDGTSLSGKRIDYDVRNAVVKAGSDADRSERVRMVIPAEALKQNQGDN